MDDTILKTINMVRITKKTCLYWLSKVRFLCTKAFEERRKMGGNGYVVEIDESLMHGKRKSNRGRYLKGDKWQVNPNKEVMDIIDSTYIQSEVIFQYKHFKIIHFSESKWKYL